MQILILGGSLFYGRHVTEMALARGHQITLFNRGRHNPDLFPAAEKLRGDRDGGLEALTGRSWDAVLDTSGYIPRLVRDSANRLSAHAGQYTFISSISAYADFRKIGIDEGYPLARLADPTVETVDGETYGGLKALCEEAVREVFPDRGLIIRPGLIVGPFDPTDRFTYWPRRVAGGGEVLAPDQPDRPAQIIDVRDLAAWTLDMMETGRSGTYNATGPDHPLTMGRILEESRKVSGSDATFSWVSERFLLEEKVGPWIELPLWVPRDPDSRGLEAIDCTRAQGAGLTYRPLAETIGDTLAWAGTLPAEREPRAGLDPARERDLLARWHAGASSEGEGGEPGEGEAGTWNG